MTEVVPLVPPLRAPFARALLVAFLALHVALALASSGPAPRVLAALLLVAAAGALAVLPARLPRLGVAAVLVGALLAAALVLAALPVAGWPGYAAWPFGAATFVALALTLRGRIGAAWLLLGGLAAESVVWSLVAGAGPLPGVDLVVRHAGTLLLGTLFAVGLRRAAGRVQALREAERLLQASRAAREVAGVEQRRAAERFLALAGPALGRLQAGESDPPALLALEGRLRDEVTAAGLLSDGLNAALAAARARGVDVVLLSAPVEPPLPLDVRARIAGWLTERLASASAARVVVRTTRPRPSVVRVSVASDGTAESMELPVG